GVWEQLARGGPASAPESKYTLFVRQQAYDHRHLAAIHKAAGRRDKAVESYQKAIAAWERLMADFPTNPEYRESLARELRLSSSVFNMTKEPGPMEAPLLRAVSVGETLVRDYPQGLGYQADLGDSQNFLGLVYVQMKRYPEAETCYLK